MFCVDDGAGGAPNRPGFDDPVCEDVPLPKENVGLVSCAPNDTDRDRLPPAGVLADAPNSDIRSLLEYKRTWLLP